MPVDYRVDIKSSRICNGNVLTESLSRQESMAMELSSPGGPKWEEKMWSKSFLWRRLRVKSTHMQAVAFKGFPVKKLSCFWQQPNGMWKGNGVCQTAGAGNARLDSWVLMLLPWGLRTGLSYPTKIPSVHVPVKPRQLSCGTWVTGTQKQFTSNCGAGLVNKISVSCWCRGWGAVPDSGKADSRPAVSGCVGPFSPLRLQQDSEALSTCHILPRAHQSQTNRV